MEKKYYTPQLSEFHQGFVFEINDSIITYGNWAQHIFGVTGTPTFDDVSLIGMYLKGKDCIRVKLLDAEDIVGENWVKAGAPNEYVLRIEKKDGHDCYLMIFSEEFRHVEIYSGPTIAYIAAHEHCRVFAGTIKNRSELRKVMEMCGVK